MANEEVRLANLELKQDFLEKAFTKQLEQTTILNSHVSDLRTHLRVLIAVAVFANGTLYFFGWLLSNKYLHITIPS